jgi:hypothetical protein
LRLEVGVRPSLVIRDVLPYLIGSILVNWLLARRIAAAEQPSRKRYLQLGLFLNIAFLSVFKYVNFFLKSFPHLIPARFLLPDFEFPLGVSFFTITQIMYLVDCTKACHRPAASLTMPLSSPSFPTSSLARLLATSGWRLWREGRSALRTNGSRCLTILRTTAPSPTVMLVSLVPLRGCQPT